MRIYSRFIDKGVVSEVSRRLRHKNRSCGHGHFVADLETFFISTATTDTIDRKTYLPVVLLQAPAHRP